MATDSRLGSFGRYQETPVGQMSPEIRDAYDFTKQLRGQVPGPHKIWLANPKLSKTIVPTGKYYQTESSLTKAEIEIATSVINGRWLAAYSNYEHEKIAEEQGHLPPERVQALIDGLPTSFDDPRQQIVYELDFGGSAVCPDGNLPTRQRTAGRCRNRGCNGPHGVVYRGFTDFDGLRRPFQRRWAGSIRSMRERIKPVTRGTLAPSEAGSVDA